MRLVMVCCFALVAGMSGGRVLAAAAAAPTKAPATAKMFDARSLLDPDDPAQLTCIPRAECCRICTRGQACGNSCISRGDQCHRGDGCACDAADVCD